MKKTLSILLIVAIVSMCGCVDIPGYNDQEILDEYNEYIDTWNRDHITHSSNLCTFGDAIDAYGQEVDSYNAALWGDKNRVEIARDELKDAQFTYKTNAIAVKGRLEMFRTFLYENQNTLERNGVDVRHALNGINDWIAGIDYNIQFAGI